ncbi:hypothetical protein BgAZ_201980 [Babesia gibsoni]|uniref:Uncharacterized protein n=1 Tax=Babesia gibsoni TaxID=33632 RepID=A0AAD8LRP7_BABGI|nr:hypothetical protein BgAZ_201980 [Babesia gibsoni]
MSLQFLRNLNKNVKESLSALNEGLEITNGVAEVGKLHLPYILQLLPRNEQGTTGEQCCIFANRDILRAISERDGGNTPGNQSPNERPPSSRTLLKLIEEDRGAQLSDVAESPERNDELGNHIASPPQSQRAACPLGAGCILKNIDESTFEEALQSIDEFIGNVDKAFDTQSAGTRHLLETEALPVLCRLLRLAEVANFLNDPPPSLLERLKNAFGFSAKMFDQVVFTLKHIDRMLAYPDDILKGQSSKVYKARLTPRLRAENPFSDAYSYGKSGMSPHHTTGGQQGGVESKKHDCSVLDYLGNIGVLSIDQHKRERLQHVLSLFDYVAISTDFGRSIMTVAGVCLGGVELSELEIVEKSLQIILKLYTHNDVNWMLYQEDDQKLYTVDKLDSFYTNWQISCNGLCYSCGKPLGIRDIPESVPTVANATLCLCLIDRNDIVSPNRHLIEQELLNSAITPFALLKLALQSSDMVVRTRVTGLLLQMTLNSPMVSQHIVESGCIERLLELIEGCCIDQFGVLNAAMDALNSEYWEKAAAEVDGELAIGMSFVPCALDCIMILRHCIKTAGCMRSDVSKVVKSVVQLTMTMLKVCVYLNCSGRESVKDVASRQFVMCFSIVLDTCIGLLTCRTCVLSENSKRACNGWTTGNMAKVALHNLADFRMPVNTDVCRGLLEAGLVEAVLVAAHLLISQSRFGRTFNEETFAQLMRFIAVIYVTSKRNTTARQLLVERLRAPIGKNIPPLFSCLYSMMQEADIESMRNSDITSQQVAMLNQLRMETIGDAANVPPLLHWLLAINDADVSVTLNEHLHHLFLKMMISAGTFDGNETANSIVEYAQLILKDLLLRLNNNTTDDQSNLICRLVGQMQLSIALLRAGKLDKMNLTATFKNPWKLGMEILNAAVGDMENGYTDKKDKLLVKVLSLLAVYLSIPGDNESGENIDVKPLLEIVKMEEMNERMIQPISAFVITLAYALGTSINEDVINLDFAICMSKHLRTLYQSEEHVYMVKVTNELEESHCIDPLMAGYEDMQRRFLSQIRRDSVSNAVDILLTGKAELQEFTLPTKVHLVIKHFRGLMHSQAVQLMMEDIKTTALIHGAESVGLNSVAEAEVKRLRKLHAEEMEFAQNRIAQITSQLNVITESYFMVESNLKALKAEMEGVSKENASLKKKLKG